MNIKEAEKLTGVSIRNIRFYEQKGLLIPSRNKENDYREYTADDIRALQLIRALRMVDMPIEQIRDVMQGNQTLQAAVLLQRDQLTTKIKKLETAVRFCDELVKVEESNIEEILTRMDEPENRRLLSKSWPTDYAKQIKDILLPIGASLLPLFISWPLGMFLLLLAFLRPELIYLQPVAFLIGWGILGYCFFRREKWGRSAVLIHIVPGVIYALQAWQQALPDSQRISIIREFLLSYDFLFATLDTITIGTVVVQISSLVKFLLLVAAFCLGGLAAWSVRSVKAKWKKKATPKKEHTHRFLPKLVALFAALVLPVILIVVWCIFAPLSKTVTPETLERNLSVNNTVWVEVGDDTRELTGVPEFAECFRFDQWQRKYFWNPPGEPELVVQLSADPSEPYAIAFYSDDTVWVYEVWITSVDGYYRVPDGVMEAVLAYAEENGLPVSD